MLGVCLGHQIIVQALGGRIIRAEEPMHGKRSEVIHNGDSRLWESIPSPFQAGRYHSLIVDRQQLPASLRVAAESGDVIMAVQHRDYPVYGVQFHPESVLTEHGYQLIANFLRAAGIQASIPAEAKL
jgi:anthranilate synthase/aminodeoxychorismate synthase-like glutamine amidotransferase